MILCPVRLHSMEGEHEQGSVRFLKFQRCRNPAQLPVGFGIHCQHSVGRSFGSEISFYGPEIVASAMRLVPPRDEQVPGPAHQVQSRVAFRSDRADQLIADRHALPRCLRDRNFRTDRPAPETSLNVLEHFPMRCLRVA